MLDYFLSSDWAIIATELLAGFIVISLLLSIMLWRGQRRHTDAAERLLDDRDPILRASEEMLDRQVQRVWPELTVNDEQRESYAERSLDAVEAMVEPWLEPKRYELAAVARRFLQVRQADLDQLLTLAHAQAEQNDGDDSRTNELENHVNELREQRDRQAKQLAESLETVNVMVREYGRKFDYNNEPHVATVLKAIVMIQEMDAGADCETAKSRADEVFIEDLVASTTAVTDDADDFNGIADEDQSAAAEETAEDEPALSPEDEMAAAMAEQGVSNEKTDAMEAAAKERGEQPSAAARSEAEAIETNTAGQIQADDQSAGQSTEEAGAEAKEQAVAAAGDQDDTSPDTNDIDQLIESAATTERKNTDTETSNESSSDETALTEERETTGDSEEAPQPSSEPELNREKTPSSSSDSEDKTVASSQPSEPEDQDVEPESPEQSDAPRDERREDKGQESENGVIDLDDVEIPKDDKKDNDDDTDQEFDLDDIDALLDAEIARKHGKSNE